MKKPSHQPAPAPRPRMIFSTPMVLALLERRKTQTRRLVTWRGAAPRGGGVWRPDGRRELVHEDGRRAGVLRMPCAPGDVVDVLETFWSLHDTECDGDSFTDWGPTLDIEGTDVQYVASPLNRQEPGQPGRWESVPGDGWDGEGEPDLEEMEDVWLPWEHYTRHPAIHMPRWAVRLKLRVIEVRVERLWAITADDAAAEGVAHDAAAKRSSRGGPERGAFRDLWQRINGKRAPWRRNPWVYRIRFELEDGAAHKPRGGRRCP